MIGRLTGAVADERLDGTLIVDVHGVGYVVRASSAAHTLARQSPAAVTFLIHTIVREDVLDLYGFASDDELSFFKLLLEVSGVGPKTALGILNPQRDSRGRRGVPHARLRRRKEER
jgi:holliday junction DNA helicase RuvA